MNLHQLSNIIHFNTLKQTKEQNLHNKGLLTGIVQAFMVCGYEFDAVMEILQSMKHQFYIKSIPPAWIPKFKEYDLVSY